MVKVRLYGWLAERMGWRERELEFNGSLKELLSILGEELGEWLSQGRVMVAVNHSLEKDISKKISNDDIIAFLPAFSGG